MKLLIGSLMVFFATMMAAALVALFEPTGGQYWNPANLVWLGSAQAGPVSLRAEPR
ncbi:MAG TPA: hypothetical protein VLJ58_04635 [Ramlibacter sp.]|nr:hypothetical protein [Ramlibacter sp.]